MTWTTDTLPSGSGYIYGFAVPSTTVCYSGTYISGDGWVIIKTTDGGSTWNIQTLPSDLQFDDVACPSTTTCYAVGSSADDNSGRFVATTDGGTTWTDQTPSSGYGTFLNVACPSATECFALNRELPAATLRSSAPMTVERPGATRPFPSRPGVSSVSRVRATDCYVSGQGTGLVGGLILQYS